MDLAILGSYFQRAAPPFVLGILFLFLIPKALIEWRMVTYILLFILLRDLMTPLGLWGIDVSAGTLRLPDRGSLLPPP